MNTLVENLRGLSSSQIREVADLVENIEAQENRLLEIMQGKLNGAAVGSTAVSKARAAAAPAGERVIRTKSGQTRHLTPEAIAKISAAQKRRHRKNRLLKNQAATAPAAPTNGGAAPAATTPAATAPATAAPATPAPAAPAAVKQDNKSAAPAAAPATK